MMIYAKFGSSVPNDVGAYTGQTKTDKNNDRKAIFTTLLSTDSTISTSKIQSFNVHCIAVIYVKLHFLSILHPWTGRMSQCSSHLATPQFTVSKPCQIWCHRVHTQSPAAHHEAWYSISFWSTSPLHHVRSFLTDDVVRTVACSIVQSRLDYCNALFTGMSEANLSKLQRVQNTLARVVLRRVKYEHITPALSELHWLPVRQRIDFTKWPRSPYK